MHGPPAHLEKKYTGKVDDPEIKKNPILMGNSLPPSPGKPTKKPATAEAAAGTV